MNSSGNEKSGTGGGSGSGQGKRTGKENDGNGKRDDKDKDRKKGSSSSSKGEQKNRNNRRAPLPFPVMGKGRLSNSSTEAASQIANTHTPSSVTSMMGNYFWNNHNAPSTPATAALTQCSSTTTLSSIGTEGGASSGRNVLPSQQDVATTRHSHQRTLALSTIVEAQEDGSNMNGPNNTNQAGTESLPLQMAQVQYVGAATVFLFVAFFYLALPLAANVALVLFASFVVLLGRTMYSLLYTYAMQQWNVIQQQGLANYVPEAMRPYVDPQHGTTVHEFMTADGTFVRDHMYLGLYAMPGLTPQQQDFYINQLPSSRRQVLYQRGMVLPFLPEEAQRVVLGEEGFRRYQQQLGLGGVTHGVDVPSVPEVVPATDALARMLPPANVSFHATDIHQHHDGYGLEQEQDSYGNDADGHRDHLSDMGGTQDDTTTLVRRNINFSIEQQEDEHPLFLQPWQEPQPSFRTVLRGISRTALSLVAGEEIGSGASADRPSGDQQTETQASEHNNVVDHVPHALNQENYNDDDDMVWEVQISQRDSADVMLSDHDSSSVGSQSGSGAAGAAAPEVAEDRHNYDGNAGAGNEDDNEDTVSHNEYAQDEWVLTNAFTSMMRNFTATATLSASSTMSPLLSYWTPIVGGVGVTSTVSWISMVVLRYPQAIPRWPHLTLASGSQLMVAAFGGIGRRGGVGVGSNVHVNPTAVTNRMGRGGGRDRDWGILSIGLFSLATLGSAGGMMLLQRQLRAAAERARQYEQSCSLFPKEEWRPDKKKT
jgi:hypothetical protein